MPAPRRTHYDELGVAPKAQAADIERAYRKYRAQADSESAAPDRARETRMSLAYETLSNPDKRAMYDIMLAAPERKKRSLGLVLASIGVAILATAAGVSYLLQPPPPPPPGTATTEKIAHDASQAMARVDSIDLSGKSAPIGLAFAIADGVVATSCGGITPLSQLTLYMAPRTTPVKVEQVDEKLGVCKLRASGIGSWPLIFASADPAPGETVYATKMNAVGEVSLVEATVKRVVPTPRGKAIEMSVAVLPERQGGPVFNSRGHVVGVQLRPEGSASGEVVRVTPDWALRAMPVERAAAPVAAPAPVEAQPPLELKTREQIAEDRRRRIEEAVRRNVQ